jgi:hypothetical protein
MIIAAHQPNWMPWLGYWNKMPNVDKVILLDAVQYTRGNYINRVQLKNKKGRFWWTLPTSAGLQDRICDAMVVDGIRDKLWNQLFNAYHGYEFWEDYSEYFHDVVTYPSRYLSEINYHALKTIARLLDIDTNKFILQSEIGGMGQKTDLLIDLCNKVGADTYFSGHRGGDYMDLDKFNDAGIKVEFQDFIHPEYFQQIGKFETGLSIVDVLCNCGIDTVKKMIS